MTRGRPETSRAERTTPAGRRRDGARHGSRAAPGLLSQWHGAAQGPVFCGPRAYDFRPAAAHRRSPREPGDERRPGGRNPASGTAGSRRKRQGRSGEARPGRRKEHTRHNRQAARQPCEDGNRALARYNGLAALARRRQRPGRAQGYAARSGEAAGIGGAPTHPETPTSTTPAAPRRSSRRAGRRCDLKRERPPGRAPRGPNAGARSKRGRKAQAQRPQGRQHPGPRSVLNRYLIPPESSAVRRRSTRGTDREQLKSGPRGTADGKRPRRRKRGRGRPAAGKG